MKALKSDLESKHLPQPHDQNWQPAARDLPAMPEAVPAGGPDQHAAFEAMYAALYQVAAGVWDASNRAELAGKPCEWCAIWSEFKAAAKESGISNAT